MPSKSHILAPKHARRILLLKKVAHQSCYFGHVGCEDVESGVTGENVSLLLLRLGFSKFCGATGAHRQVEDLVAAYVHVAGLGVQGPHLLKYKIKPAVF